MDAINVFGPTWEKAESYGRVARELAKGLRRRGVWVNAFGPYAPHKPIQTRVGGIVMGYPTGYKSFGHIANAGRRLAVCFWESTKLPAEWPALFNKLDGVIVSCVWNVDVFKSSGVTVPVHYIPLGISSAYKYIERVRTGDEPFTFIAFADRGPRKGWHYAATAFVRAFGDDMRYKLILKTRKGGLGITITNPNIELLSVDLSDKRMAELYSQADCMIFPAAAEGFGFPPREFAATGGIALATDFGGTADDLAEWGMPIRVEKMETAWRDDPNFYGKCGEWAVPDMGDLVNKMQQVAGMSAEERRIKGKYASQFIRKIYKWQTFADDVWSTWDQVVINGNHNAARPVS